MPFNLFFCKADVWSDAASVSGFSMYSTLRSRTGSRLSRTSSRASGYQGQEEKYDNYFHESERAFRGMRTMRRPVIPLHSKNLQVIHGRNFDRSSECLDAGYREGEPQVERREKNHLTVGRDNASRGVSQVSGYSGSSVSQVSYCHSPVAMEAEQKVGIEFGTAKF